MSNRQVVHDLKSLVRSFHSLIVIETVEEERVRSLLAALAVDLGQPLLEWSVTTGLREARGAAVGGTERAATMLEEISNRRGDALYLLKDLASHLGHPENARLLRELVQKLANTHSALILTGDPIELPRELEALAVRFELDLPDDGERRAAIRAVVESLQTRQPVQVDLTRDDVHELVNALSGLTLHQARRVIAQAILDDGRLCRRDLNHVIRLKGEIIERGGMLEFYPPREIRHELGGFGRLKTWLERARVGFSGEARALNLHPPKGVLLVGVQGCGKSLAAKYIAEAWELPLLKLDAGRLYEKYVGESEKNFRRAARVAEAMAPVVLWIDELEKAFASGTGGEADGGLSQRLFGSFLTWLQEKKEGVFVVGAANDLARMPPELLRKGRFDEIFFVDLPTRDERMAIAEIHLRLRRQDPHAHDLVAIAEASAGYSGAEIEAAIIAALYRALHAKEPLTTEGLLHTIRETVPLSVSRREDIERIRTFSAGRFTPVA